MVDQIKKDLTERWPSLILVMLLAGGGTSVGNIVTGSSGKIDELTSEVRELHYAVRSSWSMPMEASSWERAGRELRKTIPDWVGPDSVEIRKLHMGDSR